MGLHFFILFYSHIRLFPSQFWLMLILAYTIYFIFVDKACLFSAINYGCDFKPHAYYIDGMDEFVRICYARIDSI
jgi:hypothetical protein